MVGALFGHAGLQAAEARTGHFRRTGRQLFGRGLFAGILQGANLVEQYLRQAQAGSGQHAGQLLVAHALHHAGLVAVEGQALRRFARGFEHLLDENTFKLLGHLALVCQGGVGPLLHAALERIQAGKIQRVVRNVGGARNALAVHGSSPVR